MNGILIVDKPTDWTSHDVVAKLRGAFRTKRIGHGGTLDPMATGVLPIFMGRATRAASYSENAQKEYIAGLRLGIVTDTQDTTGNILKEDGIEAAAKISTEALTSALETFKGPQKQIPPMYSAIKKEGKKLYELARKGIEIEREARDITIYEIELYHDKMDSPTCSAFDYYIRVVCSKGTYIRTLCHDIGKLLGCGGTMSYLQRTRAGAFTLDASHTLDEILDITSQGHADGLLLPVDSLFKDNPEITLDEVKTSKMKNGVSLTLSQEDGIYRFYGPDREFLTLSHITGGKTKIIKGFFEPA